MEKAIILSAVAVLALLGLHKIVDWLEAVVSTPYIDPPVVIFYKMERNSKNAELIVRSLSREIRKIGSAKKGAVYIISDGLDENTLEISKKTSAQLSNVFVGGFEEGMELLFNTDT